MKNKKDPFVIVLGIAQDGGMPHAGCQKSCCEKAWQDLSQSRFVTSLAILDPLFEKAWLIDIGPDFRNQLHFLNSFSFFKNLFDGIFLTHGHVGHYIGLFNLEKAVMDSSKIPVFAMPKMTQFILKNSPWKNLSERENIVLRELKEEAWVDLGGRLSLKPILVPHRSDFTETVGFVVRGSNKRLIFVPDIDFWSEKIKEVIEKVDTALLDGTFFGEKELPGRDMSKVPHPLIKESVRGLSHMGTDILFIHLNHTNPVLSLGSKERRWVKEKGFDVAKRGQRFKL